VFCRPTGEALAAGSINLVIHNGFIALLYTLSLLLLAAAAAAASLDASQWHNDNDSVVHSTTQT